MLKRKPLLVNIFVRASVTTLAALLLTSLNLNNLPAGAAVRKEFASADETTRRAIALFDNNRFEEGIELEKQAALLAPSYWMPHAALSVLDWRRNRYDDALKEGREAIRLAPENELVNLNFAQMNQQLGYYEAAMPAFRKAVKVAPDDWVPRIGLVQCCIATSNQSGALGLLDQMSKKSDGNFDWWYHLSTSYAHFDKVKQAAIAARRAREAATSEEQEQLANEALFQQLILSKDFEEARLVEEFVLKGRVNRAAVIVLDLNDLCPASNPAHGRAVIERAIAGNLLNAQAYFDIGQACAQKCRVETMTAEHQTDWLANAEIAYRAAIKSDATQSRYWLALAGVFDRSGRNVEMFAALRKAKELDVSDSLAPYLVSSSKIANNDLAAHLREALMGIPEKPYRLNLLKEDFEIDNLHCNCRVSAIEFQLRHEGGIEFVAITHRDKPIKGTVLVDAAYGSARAFENVGKKEQMVVHVVSSRPISTISEAINTALTLADVTQVSNTWSFVPEAPKMPLF